MRHGQVWASLFTLLIASVSLAGPSRKNRPDPETHVPALLNVLKSDKDEKKRIEAAEELREYDGKAFPDIIPALTEALTSDPSASVRATAAESIGNVRPISPKAGYALEQAISNDKSISVRFAARTALFQYRILGYFGGSKPDAAVAQTAEPPLAALTDNVRPSPSTTLIRPAPSKPTAPPSTNMPLPTQAKPSEPSNNTSMFPFLNRLNPFTRSTPAPAPVMAKDKSQSSEPPVARPMAPPKKDFGPVDEPPVNPKSFVPPAVAIPTLPKPMATLTSEPRPALVIPLKPIPNAPLKLTPTVEGPELK